MKFTQEHEWLTRDGNVVTVGITEYAVRELGDLVFVELPETGAVIAAGGEAAVVESVKAASDIYAPAAGRITEINQSIVDNPSLVNEDPQGDGWFFRMEFDHPEEFDDFMDQEEYTALIQ